MTSRSIVFAIAVTIGCVVAANLVVSRAASHSVPRQTIQTINSAGPVIDVFGMGNSLMAAAFDAEAVRQTFQKAGRTILAANGALGATGAIEHLELTRLALQRHQVQDLVYGFSDQQMSTQPPLKNSDLIGNIAMLYYVEPRITLRYARFDLWDLIEFQTFRCCALLRERSNIWAKVEKLRRAMQEVGMPRQETNQFGRRADFDLLDFAGPEQFTEACRSVMRSGDFMTPALQELFKEAKSHGSRVTVVEMPGHPRHLKRFYDLPVWQEYRAANRAAINRAGLAYIDASRWIPDVNDFQDSFHLDGAGASKFSRLLAEGMLASVSALTQ
jgi:hypothetical protein